MTRKFPVLCFTMICVAYCASIFLVHAQQGEEISVSQLESMQKLVGSWKGVAQPKRGSSVGAWGETADWVWEFNQLKEPVGLRFTVEGNKYLNSALLTLNQQTGEFKLVQTLEDKSTREYAGKMEKNVIELTSAAKVTDVGYKIKITPLSNVRLLVLYEQKLAGRIDYGRVVEVGYTRKGVKLAQEGQGGPICIVTGGEGTSAVTYQGKTYYVCCSGCKDAFTDDPEKFIKLAAERAAKKKAGIE